MNPIVIIGSGLAGYSFARELRRLDKTTPVLILTGDGGEAYSKPMLSSAFSQNKQPDQLVTATSTQQAEQLAADIRVRTRVTSIDVAKKTIATDHDTISYSKLVLAIGAHQRQVTFAGDAGKNVITVNNLDDYRALRQRLSGTKRRIAIIGAGLIGCEFANDMRAGEHAVVLISRTAEPLDRLVPAEVGSALRAALVQIGVDWHGPATVVSVSRQNDGLLLELDNGPTLPADVVLSATGLNPNTELATRAGLKINRGIVVDAQLRTSADDVYAIGDCAEVGGTLLPYVMPLMNQARTLAKILTGDPTPLSYPVMPVVVKTTCFPIVAVPPSSRAGSWRVETIDGGVKACFYDEKHALAGFALGGTATAEKAALAKQTPAIALQSA